MGCEHTMLTYTRCMDSALCVPLMIDVAIFCDYFSARGASPKQAGAALAYLFKVNEGAAVGVDPGFFNQSAVLSGLLHSLPLKPIQNGEGTSSSAVTATSTPTATAATAATTATPSTTATPTSSGRIVGCILCAGLSCLDMQLLRADSPTSAEAIAQFRGCELTAGGSASNAASALRAMGVDAAVLTCTGEDAHGAELAQIYETQGIDTTLLLRSSDVSTSLAVLPVFRSGGRGCWVDLSANDHLTCDAMADAVMRPEAEHIRQNARGIIVGYPHLLSNLQGTALCNTLTTLSATLISRPIVGVDINGATLGAFGDEDGVLGPALDQMDVLHANLEELCHVAGVASDELTESASTLSDLRGLVRPFLDAGVAVVAVTLGQHGAYVAVTEDAARLTRSATLAAAASQWVGSDIRLPALPLDGELNANGAGDAFTAGLVAAMLWQPDGDDAGAEGAQSRFLSLEKAVTLALGSARQRVDSSRREYPQPWTELLGSASG